VNFKELDQKIRDGHATAAEQREYARILRGANHETRGEPDTRGARNKDDSPDAREVREWLANETPGKFPRTFSLDTPEVVKRRFPEAFETRTSLTDEIRTSTDGNSAGLDVSLTDGSAGGYTVGVGFWDHCQIALRKFGNGAYRDMHLVQTDDGRQMPWPTNNPTAIEATVMSELTQIVPADTWIFGLGMLNAYTSVAPLALASWQLYADSQISVEAFVGARLGESIGRNQADLSWNGTGAAQAEGIYTAITSGGAVSGTVAAGDSGGGYIQLGNAVSVDSLLGSSQLETTDDTLSAGSAIRMVKAVDPAYYPNAKFYLAPSTAWNMRGLTDDNGRPLITFDRTLEDGVAGTLLGFPVVLDNYASPIAVQADPVVATGPVFGDLDAAFVRREVKGVQVMKLNERFADFLAVAWLGYIRFDIRSNDLRAVVGVAGGTS
jgi:HK97 family phage major capsid protein